MKGTLPRRCVTSPLEGTRPDRLEPPAGNVLLRVLRRDSKGGQRRPRHHPVLRQGMDERLYFGVAGYTHGIFLARKTKRVQEIAAF
jgi:hypothetical protein